MDTVDMSVDTNYDRRHFLSVAAMGMAAAQFGIFGSANVSRLGGPMVRTHKPGEAVFRSVLPEDSDWEPFPAFPPSVRLAIVVAQPSEPGPYLIRVKVPSGVKLMPHRHPEDRIYTVISGVFYIGLGDEFDGAKLEACSPDTVIVLPGNTSHFHWAKSGEYVAQVTAIGPFVLNCSIICTRSAGSGPIAARRAGTLSPA